MIFKRTYYKLDKLVFSNKKHLIFSNKRSEKKQVLYIYKTYLLNLMLNLLLYNTYIKPIVNHY